jgi:hypothetical protein
MRPDHITRGEIHELLQWTSGWFEGEVGGGPGCEPHRERPRFQRAGRDAEAL